ncbi:MAG: hypothetical protein ACTSUE_14605 [Promethearchaeota archaeon]
MSSGFFFNHLYVSFIGWIIQTTVMIGFIWFPKSSNPGKEYKNKFIQGLRAIPYIIMFFFGWLFMHVFVEMLSGNYPLAAWTQFLPSTILAGVCGATWLVASVGAAPNVKTIVAASFYTGIIWTMIYITIPLTSNVWDVLILVAVWASMYIFYLIAFGIESIVKILKPRWSGDKQLWNIRPFLKKNLLGWKFNLALWLSLTLEMMAQAAGYSIISIFTG